MGSTEVAVYALSSGAVCALAATPAAAAIARRTGFLDRPLGYKGHARPTPYLGGSALVLAFGIAAVALGEGTGRFLPVLLGAIVLWAVGTIDDRVSLSPWTRIAAATAVATGLWAGDLGWNVLPGTGLDFLLTVVWVLGLVNAFNLMDNMDGASSSVAAAASLGIGFFALQSGDLALVGISFGLAGACVGFLRWNLARPARIFLGDGGSMPLGFVVAAMAIAAPSTAELGASAVLTAALLVGLVILDTTLVIISRRRRGVRLLTGGRDHLTHRLLGLLHTPRRVAAALAGAQLALCALALASAKLGLVATCGTALAALIAGICAIVALERLLEPSEATPEASASTSPCLATGLLE